VDARSAQLWDARPRPQIGAESIFQATYAMGVFGLGSLLGLDQFVRTTKGKKLFGTSKPLDTDTTLSRSLTGFGLDALHPMLEAVYAAGRGLGVGRCEVAGGRLRIGMIDGSRFGQLWASCFAHIGSVCLMGGIEPFPTFGKELPASEALVRKLHDRFGPRFVDLLLLDALYVAQGFLRACLDACQTDVLIKTQEEELNIIQDAMGLFRHYEAYAEDIEHICGVDPLRMRSYEVYAATGFSIDGVEAPFKVAWVIEADLRTGEHIEFWVLTSLEDLSADDMRELAHWRWDIENNGFKSFNDLVHTKHLYAHDEHAAEAILLILLIAGDVLQLFLRQISLEEIWQRFGKVKPTRRFLQGELRDSLSELPMPDT
jgi:hypothetical protein